VYCPLYITPSWPNRNTDLPIVKVSHSWLPCNNVLLLESRTYPWKCSICGCLTTTAFDQTRHIAPSLRLLDPNGLTEYYRPFLPDVSTSDVHPWVDPCDDFSPAVPAAPSLRPFSRAPPSWGASRSSVPIQFFFFFFLILERSILLRTPLPTCYGCDEIFFFGGERIFQKMPLLFSCSRSADMAIRLSISSSMVFLALLSDVLLILCCACCRSPRQFIPLLYS
jgi:hypothetical protein